MTIRILIADDHNITREGLRALIDKKADFEVVAEAENGRAAISLARKHLPDVVVMDINMPDLNGIDAARQIMAELPETRIIALSMYSDRSYIKGMLKSGVAGYLLKSCAFEDLSRAIITVMRHQTYLSPNISEIVRKEFVKMMETDEAAAPSESLTDKEREVLQLIAEGRKTKEIAHLLNISIKTVEARRGKIMEKLKINHVAGLTKFAIKAGLTSVEFSTVDE